MLDTNRLRLHPAPREEAEQLVELQTDAEMKSAYQQMLEGGLAHRWQWVWYTPGIITLKDGTFIGDLCFKGVDTSGAAEIGYGLLPDYVGKGYATEAVSAAVRWALDQPGICRIEAETEPDNLASQRVLKKCGFTPSGIMGKEGPRFCMEK